MAGARNSPEDRVKDKSKELTRVRRKYKVNTRTKKRYVAGEEEAISVSVAVLKVAGFSNVQIARTLGISRGQTATILEKPEISELLVILRQDLTDAAIDLLQSYSIEAVQAIVDVMRVSTDDKIVITAAAEILDRAGIPKLTRSEKRVENEERTVFTDDGIVEEIRKLPPEKQEEAAQMIEDLQTFLGEHAGVTEGSDDDESD